MNLTTSHCSSNSCSLSLPSTHNRHLDRKLFMVYWLPWRNAYGDLVTSEAYWFEISWWRNSRRKVVSQVKREILVYSLLWGYHDKYKTEVGKNVGGSYQKSWDKMKFKKKSRHLAYFSLLQECNIHIPIFFKMSSYLGDIFRLQFHCFFIWYKCLSPLKLPLTCVNSLYNWAKKLVQEYTSNAVFAKKIA